PEAAGTAEDQRVGCNPAVAEGSRKAEWHHALHAADSGSHGGGYRQQNAISVHAGRSGPERTVVVYRKICKQVKRTARPGRCRERFANARPGHRDYVQSRDSDAAGYYGAEHRRRALRCLWPAASHDALHATESISRDSGSAAAIPAAPGQPEPPLY